MSLKENLKTLMLRHGRLSVSDLAKATSIPQPTLHQLSTGDTTHPRQKTLNCLANYFSITINQLMGVEPLPDTLPRELKKQLHLKTTPILSWQDLHDWPEGINLESKKEIILENNSSHQTFAIEMLGSSMEPIFPPGCLLIFDSNKVAKDRDCVLIYFKKNQQFLFKKLLIDGSSAYVKSINSELHSLTTIKLSSQDKIIATLIEARLIF